MAAIPSQINHPFIESAPLLADFYGKLEIIPNPNESIKDLKNKCLNLITELQILNARTTQRMLSFTAENKSAETNAKKAPEYVFKLDEMIKEITKNYDELWVKKNKFIADYEKQFPPRKE